MIQIDFAPADLARLRFAHSPMAEVVASGRVLSQPGPPAVCAAWRAAIAARLAGAGLDLLLALVASPNCSVPDFLTPVPAVSRPSLEEELRVVIATPADRVAAEVDAAWAGQLPPQLARFGTDPAAALGELAGQIRRYLGLAVAPVWPRLRAVAQGEIVRRALAAAEHGPWALVAGLHPLLDWDGSALRLSAGKDGRWGLDGHPLALLPASFAGQTVYSMPASPAGRALWYAPPGYGTVWGRRPAEPTAALAALLGPTRAAVLALLDVPYSTGEVAATLRLAPATASHHLTRLRDAGLVSGQRIGRRLRYTRTTLGDQLDGRASAHDAAGMHSAVEGAVDNG